MADEYISREDVLDNSNIITVQTKEYGSIEVIPVDTITDIELADVQPVRHGRWLNHHAIWIDQPKIEGWFVQAKCSECEKWAHVMNPYTKSVDYECCPHCGARMDGDTE